MRFAAYGRMAVYRSKHTFSNAGLPPAGRKHVVLSYHKQPGRAAHGNAAALKITHFNGEPARGQVYAYLRCYVRDGEIPFSVTVFDETPPDTARFGFAVTPDDAPALICSRPVQSSRAMRCGCHRTGEPADVPLRRLEMPPMRHLAGSDEQGFYWSAEGVLPAQAFRTAFGRVPRVGGILPGNAFLYDVSEPAFGAAFPVPAGAAFPPQPGSAPSSWCLIDRRVSFRSVPFFHRRIPLFRICRQMPAY